MAICNLYILIGIFTLFIYFYYSITKKLNYWKKLNIAGPKPVLLFGNYKDCIFSKRHKVDVQNEIYNAYPNEPVIGTFYGRKPVLLLKDGDVIKQVLVKNFSSFRDRGIKIHEKMEPLQKNLFHVNYKLWKSLRNKLIPVFTNNKLKNLSSLIGECTDNFNQYLAKLSSEDKPFDFRDITAKFTTEVISVCAFGLHTNSIMDGDSEFRKMGKTSVENNWYNWMRITCRAFPDWITKLMIPFFRDDQYINFFVNIYKDTSKFRKANNIRRNDYFDLLIDLENDLKHNESEEECSVILSAQAFVFFLAGFETVSSAMCGALYELAKNPVIQDKLRQELDLFFSQNQGKFSYENLKNMKYLNKVIKEALRKYPSVNFLERIAVEDHTFDDKNIFIPKGTSIIIPVNAIHHDPNIYPNPEEFDPERFSEDVENSRNPMHYLPFSHGPRKCMGDRFALIVLSMGIAMSIHDFQFQVCEQTCSRYEFQSFSILAQLNHAVFLKIKKI